VVEVVVGVGVEVEVVVEVEVEVGVKVVVEVVVEVEVGVEVVVEVVVEVEVGVGVGVGVEVEVVVEVVVGVGVEVVVVVGVTNKENAMNQALLKARKAIGNQTALLKDVGGFDNKPYQTGDHNAEITKSEVRDHRENGRPTHYVQLRLDGGEDHDRVAFLYAVRYLDDAEDLCRSATDIRKILGEDAVPGTETDEGFVVDLAALVDSFEEVAASLIGEWITVRCVDSRTLKKDGTPWQNWYVQRGLGDDAPAARAASRSQPTTQQRSARSSMAVRKKAKPRQTKQKITKRKSKR
jgi:hypothetical protein